MASLDEHYAARDMETRILAALRAAGLNPEDRLSPEDLAAAAETDRWPRDRTAAHRVTKVKCGRPPSLPGRACRQ